MSGIGDADLVRVRSRDELRAGMTVVVKRCVVCGHAHQLTLIRLCVDIGSHVSDGTPCLSPSGWAAVPTVHGLESLWCFCGALATGNLYRLRDLDDAEEEGRRIACDIDDRRRAGVNAAVALAVARIAAFGDPNDAEGGR